MISPLKIMRKSGPKMWVPGPPNSAVAKYVIELYKGLFEKGTLEGYPAPGGPYWQYLNTLRGIDYSPN